MAELSRRSALKGVMNGAAIAVGVPMLDMFLDGNGTAMAATGAAVPVRFGTWFWGLGVNPSRWFPSTAGANYELKPVSGRASGRRPKSRTSSSSSITTTPRPST